MIGRRHILFAGTCALLGLAPARVYATAMSRITAYAFTFKGLDGGPILLSSYAGHPLLVVNTASLCGYTPQYAGLQELWSALPRQGSGRPRRAVQRFRRPGTRRRERYPRDGAGRISRRHSRITEKVAVKGKDAHPFYKWAALERPLEAPRWNFHKYLVGRDGYLKAGFTSAVEPTDPRIIAAIEKELAAE